ncbi:uncharacterized protein LOC141601333 [Silene latifolia]|uniref:uncharacterized protein LOC141601333 n=1 Tax=Silene latifolia TaxID=37657 RepID=UPI003D76B9BD
MNNLKRRLKKIGAKWAYELPFVLWSDRTTPKVATGQSPFSLVYGAEAVIPSEGQIPTHRYANATEERNQVEMASSLDTIDELRTSAQIRMAAYKQTTTRSYNKNLSLEGGQPQNPLAGAISSFPYKEVPNVRVVETEGFKHPDGQKAP